MAEIINPFGKENIRVYYDFEDEFSPYILCFAFQHVHMCDEKEIIDYINGIISGELFSIEFFNDGVRCFGGDITADKLKELSYELLERHTGYLGNFKLKDCADSFKVRGWQSDNNYDATFVIDKSGKVTIRRVD